MNYEYQMAGIRVLLELPFEISVQSSSKPFLTKPESQEADISFVCRPVYYLPSPPADGHEENNRCYEETETGQRVFYRPSPEGEPYACVTWRATETNLLRCDYLAGQEQRLNFSMRLCDMLGLESLLLKFNGFILHSSFIRWQGQGVLFSADSGVGKSTQADLWVKYAGAEIINGDRAGLRKKNGAWAAYGLPYAGSSRVYKNESAPVSAVFMLEQAPVNEVERLSPAKALMKLYPQVTIHSWDAEFVNISLELLEDFVSRVPVYLLKCRPDEEAVLLAKCVLLKQEEQGL